MTYCPNCGIENKSDELNCSNCGSEFDGAIMNCPHCQTENSKEAEFCHKCGINLKEPIINDKPSKTLELILGIVGGIFGLLGGIFAVFVGFFAAEITGLGVSAIVASLVGMVGAIFILKNPKWGGLILIISAVWLLISISLFGVLGSALLGIAGLMAILRR